MDAKRGREIHEFPYNEWNGPNIFGKVNVSGLVGHLKVNENSVEWV